MDCRPFLSNTWRNDAVAFSRRFVLSSAHRSFITRRLLEPNARQSRAYDAQAVWNWTQISWRLFCVDDRRRLACDARTGDRMNMLQRLLPSHDIDALLGDITE